MNFSTFLKRNREYEQGNPLTQEQYDILSQQKESFETLSKANYFKDLTPSWLDSMRLIYIEHFKQPVNTMCPKCVASAMKQLHKKMQEFEKVKPKTKQNAKRSHK